MQDRNNRPAPRPLPEWARALVLELTEPELVRTPLTSGAESVAFRSLEQGEVHRIARVWYAWAREDLRSAAAFRRALDRAVGKLADDPAPLAGDAYKRAGQILAMVETEVRRCYASDTRPATRESSATLAIVAVLGERHTADNRRGKGRQPPAKPSPGGRPGTAGPLPHGHARREGDDKVRGRGHSEPGQPRRREGDAQRRRQVLAR